MPSPSRLLQSVCFEMDWINGASPAHPVELNTQVKKMIKRIFIVETFLPIFPIPSAGIFLWLVPESVQTRKATIITR